MRVIGAILGVFTVLVFIMYYQHAYEMYPNVNQTYSDITNYIMYLCLAFAFYNLGQGRDREIRLFVYYSIAEFWAFLFICYVINDILDIMITMHKVIIAISLTFFTSLIIYLKCKLWKSS